jgi:uncharacterized protein YndB with AHSA1/START domain
MAQRAVHAERVIPAPAAAIFEILADPSRHPEIDGSGSVQGVTSSAPRLALGATFSMSMHLGARYTTRNHVVEFEEGRRIAWHHFGRFIWRYELDDVESGTKVTETFDYSAPWGFVIELLGWPARNQASMERTLVRLEAVVTHSTPSP